jgi:hypothetical protein
MGDENSTDDKMVESRALVVQFVVDLFKESVMKEYTEQHAGDSIQNATLTQGSPGDDTMEDAEGDDDLFISLLINKAGTITTEPTPAVVRLKSVLNDKGEIMNFYGITRK